MAAGIGFTVALFIGSLAFSSAAIVPSAKLGVLFGSLVAAVATVVIGRVCLRGRA
ncbi:MAG: Na+/H+ antiporter NhaA [Deltaproteobacteria bacterium]|nr:Na+/H+ antiporter NhaA [Nannocystaceae bacterium]